MRNLVAIVFYSTLFFLIAPMCVILWMSFSADQYYIIQDMTYSLHWYNQIFEDDKWVNAIYNSVQIGLLSTIMALVVGVPAAIGLRKSFVGHGIVMSLVLLPIIVPPLISAVSWYFAVSSLGWYNNFVNMVLGHFLLGVPFVVISVLASLTHWKDTYFHASNVCGASKLQTFYYVQMPIIAPGILVGSLLCFMTSFDELLVAMFLSNYNTRTVPLEMWSGLRDNISPTILAVTVLTMIVSLAVMIIVTYLTSDKYKK